MQRKITFIYVIATGAIAIACSIIQVQPALFFINLFAPNPGDSYSPVLVMLIVWLILLTPLMIFLVIAKLMRKKDDQNIAPGRTGIFVTRKKSFQSSMVAIPIFVNGKKAGAVDNGRTKFFDATPGMLSVQAGSGRPASETLQTNLTEGKQLHFEMEIRQAGLFLKYVLRQV